MAKSISKLKDQARSHEQNEEWEKAAQLYQQVLRTAEQEGDIAAELGLFNRVGDIYLRLGRPQDAVTFFEQAADHYAADGLFNNAIALCNKALRHVPNRLELYRKLGRLSANQGFAVDARRWFLEYAERNIKAGALEEAFAALRELADLTEDPEVRELLARQLHAHGKSREAVAELRKAYTTRIRAGDKAGADAVRDQVRAIEPAAAETLEEGPAELASEEGPLAGLPLLEEPDYGPEPVEEPPAPAVVERAAPPPVERAAPSPPPPPPPSEPIDEERAAAQAAMDEERAAAEAEIQAAIAAADAAVAEAEQAEKAAEKVLDERAAAAARLQGFDPTLLGDVSAAAARVITPGLERPEAVPPEEVAPLPLLDLQPSGEGLTVEEEPPPLPLPLLELEEDVTTVPPLPGLELPSITMDDTALGGMGAAGEAIAPAPEAPTPFPGLIEEDLTFAPPEPPSAPPEPSLPSPQPTFAPEPTFAAEPPFAPPEPRPAPPEPTFAQEAGLAPPEPPLPVAPPEAPRLAESLDLDLAAAGDELKAAAAAKEAEFAPKPPPSAPRPPLIPFDEAEGTLAPDRTGLAPLDEERPLPELPVQKEPAAQEERPVREEPPPRPASERPTLRELILEGPSVEESPPAKPEPEEVSLRDLILEEPAVEQTGPAQAEPEEVSLRDLILEEPAPEEPPAAPPAAAEEEPFTFFAGEDALPAEWREQPAEPEPAEPEPWAAPPEPEPWAAPEEPEPWATTLEEEPWSAPEPEAPAAEPAPPASETADPVILLARSLYSHGQPAAGRAALDQLLSAAEGAGDSPRMLEVLEALADVESDDVDVHQRRVELCFSVKGPRAAVAALLGLAGALERSGQAPRASAIYQQVLDIDPSNATAGAALRREREARPHKEDEGGFVDLGAILLAEEAPPPEASTRFVVTETAPTGDEEKDFVDMLEQFKEKVAEHMGEDPNAHYDLGLAYKEMGLLDEAVAEFQIALRNGQDRLKVLEELGRCFMLKEEPRIALRLLGQALAVPGHEDVEYMGVNYLLGRCYEAVGEYDAARDAYERVVGVDIQFNDVAERLARL